MPQPQTESTTDATPLPVVLGPTGSGKSELAISIALHVDGEVVNCDSLQVFRGFDIGTAKLPLSDRKGVPHHLIDIAEPAQLFTAGDFARVATGVLHDIVQRGRVPILAGGTGFYLRALLQGLSPAPARDENVRARLQARQQRRPGSLHRILTRLDPHSAARIHPNDTNKTLRALEVRLLEGRPLTSIFAKPRAPLPGFRPIKIGLDPPRDLLYERLNTRAQQMFERGLVDEVRRLLAAGVPCTAKPLESLGYKQALQFILGALTLEQAIQSTQLETRHYAKRQLTWFRKEQDVHWLPGFGGDPVIQARAIAFAGEQRSL